MNDDIDRDVSDVMREETSRGRRRVDTAKREQRRDLLAYIRKAIDLGDERLFLTAVRKAGLKDGTPGFREALELFRAEPGHQLPRYRGKP
jgi:hypothetical protein